MDNTTNRVKFTVNFDSQAWESMDKTERELWVDRVNDAINDEAYVSAVEYVSGNAGCPCGMADLGSPGHEQDNQDDIDARAEAGEIALDNYLASRE